MTDINTPIGKVGEQPAPAAEASAISQWGSNAPKGAKAVFGRIAKEGANVPLFIGQTLINALRDLGYNNTTSAICEHVDNAIQAGAREVRVYFHDKHEARGRRKHEDAKLCVFILDNGCGMPPNVLHAAMAFGGSTSYENRMGIGRYGVGMKAAALSMSPTLEVYSWQEPKAIYRMILDVDKIGDDRANAVVLPEPEFMDELPADICTILLSSMSYPKASDDLVEPLAADRADLGRKLGTTGTLVVMQDCDQLTYRTVKTLVDHATKEMARIYRRQIDQGLRLFVNNRCVTSFDPTYRMERAWHTRVPSLEEGSSRVVAVRTLDVPVAEGAQEKARIDVRLFMLPIESWDQLPRKVLKNDLRIYDYNGISFMRNKREIHAGHVAAITGKQSTRDTWWRLEVDFPGALDEAFGVSVNKQGVRLKEFVVDIIKDAIKDDLRIVKKRIDEHWARKARDQNKTKASEAERRANEAEAIMATLLPEPPQRTDEERRILEDRLRTLAVTLKREGESDEEAFERVKRARFITTFKHDEDAAFYRVDYDSGKILLTVNTAHPFFDKLYEPLGKLAQRAAVVSGAGETDEGEQDPELAAIASDALVSLQLLLLSLGRTQSEMIYKDSTGDRERVFDLLRRQWSINLATLLTYG